MKNRIRIVGYTLPSYVYENTQGECSDILILPSVYTVLMKYIEIDGHRVEVESCEDCPLREVQMDSGYNYLIRLVCRHPNNDGEEIDAWGPSSDCPLREVE